MPTFFVHLATLPQTGSEPREPDYHKFIDLKENMLVLSQESGHRLAGSHRVAIGIGWAVFLPGTSTREQSASEFTQLLAELISLWL